MRKNAIGLCLSLVMLVGACGGTDKTLEQCVGSNNADGAARCLPIYPIACCNGLSLQKDETNCPVRKGLIGGMPMRCLPTAPECVQDNTCVANNPTLKCCTAGSTVQSDESCKAKAGLGGMTSMCKP